MFYLRNEEIEQGQHASLDISDEPSTFSVKILPAGSAPKSSTHKLNVRGELARPLHELNTC
jgi:hypothetical protein